jgi:DNA-binding NarL/FixJ family response regulator
MMERIKVFLSDNQVLFREGIHFILSGEEEFEVIGETTGNEEACSQIITNPPNIAILSITDAKLNGPEATRRIKRNLPSVSVILTVDRRDDELLFAAIKSGASACITKDTDPESLLETIKTVNEGSQPVTEALLTPGIASKALAEFNDLATLSEQLDNLLATLAPKETEVLGNIATGNTLEQIAGKLNTDEDTIHRYLRTVLNKLIANDQARAVIEAAQRSMPSIITSVTQKGRPSAEYVTREEFNEFKESLTQRLKSFIGELS